MTWLRAIASNRAGGRRTAASELAVAAFDDRRDQRRRAIAARTVAESGRKRHRGDQPRCGCKSSSASSCRWTEAEFRFRGSSEIPILRVTLHLDDGDLLRFRGALARAEVRAAGADACDIIDGAKYALDHLPIASAPGYVRARIADVQRLIVMLEDEDWLLPPAFQTEVLRALAYFGDPEDLVPDEISVIGLLDDAIVLDLLIRDLRGMLRAYSTFVEFRAAWSASANVNAADERLARIQELSAFRKRLQTRLRPPTRRKTAGALM